MEAGRKGDREERRYIHREKDTNGGREGGREERRKVYTQAERHEWRQGGRWIGKNEGIYAGRKTRMEAGREGRVGKKEVSEKENPGSPSVFRYKIATCRYGLNAIRC